MPKKIDTNFDYNEKVKKCKTIDDVIGKNGLIQKLVKDVLENILESEIEDYLERQKASESISVSLAFYNILYTTSQIST